MSNFRQDILEAVGEQNIVAIQILGKVDACYEDDYRDSPELLELIGKSHSPEVILPLLDYGYDCDFGMRDCHDIYIWTEQDVYYIHEYDGSTEIRSIPRNPN